MASQMCKDWILETIDQLRKRKARPDVDRICHMVERKHGLSSKDIEHELETLVDAGIVVKVEYKGSTSYRNAAKWKKSHLGGNVLNSNDISRKLCTAVKCASDNNSAPTDGNAGGAASLADIEQWLSSNDAVTSLTGNDLELALTREIDQGNIKQLDSGKFMVVSEDEREKTTIQANVKGGGTSGKTPSPGRRGRPAGKRKIPASSQQLLFSDDDETDTPSGNVSPSPACSSAKLVSTECRPTSVATSITTALPKRKSPRTGDAINTLADRMARKQKVEQQLDEALRGGNNPRVAFGHWLGTEMVKLPDNLWPEFQRDIFNLMMNYNDRANVAYQQVQPTQQQ